MRPDQLPHQPVQRIEPAGVIYEQHGPDRRLVLWGVHGAGDYVVGVHIHNTYVERRRTVSLKGDPPETVDQLRDRAMSNVVPTLPPTALRDSKGSAVGYFVYEGLPVDHCRAKAYEEGAR